MGGPTVTVPLLRLILNLPDPLTRVILEALAMADEQLNQRADDLEAAIHAMVLRVDESFARLRAELEAQQVKPETLARFDAIIEMIHDVDRLSDDGGDGGDGGDDEGDTAA
jgi:predicted Zn-dependent protease